MFLLTGIKKPGKKSPLGLGFFLSFMFVFLLPLTTQLKAQDIFSNSVSYFENSQGQLEGQITENLRGFFNDNSISYDEQIIEKDFSYHSFFSNIIVSVGNPRTDKILLAIPMLSENKIANRIIPTVKELLIILKDYDGPEIEFVFLASEAYGQRGIEHYLRSQISSEISYVIYLGFEFIGAKIDLEYGWSRGLSPAWLLKSFIDSKESDAIQFEANLTKTQGYLLGASRISPIENFMKENIPTMGLITRLNSLGPLELRTLDQTDATEFREDLKNLLLNQINRGIEIAPNQSSFVSADTNYQTLAIGSAILVITEQEYLIFLLAVMAVCLAWALTFRKRRRRYERAIGKNIWHLPVFFLLTSLFLVSGGLLIELIESARNFINIWQYSPLAFLIIKVAAAIFIFTFLYALSHQLPFTRNGNFYSASAIIILFFDILIFTAINITFSWYFIWALLWAFLFSLSRRPWLKVICFLLSPLWFLYGIVQLFSSNQLGFIELLINADIGSSMMIAFILLPFLLLFIRLDLLIIHPKDGQQNIASRYFAIFFASMLILMVIYGFIYEPYSPVRPQRIEIAENHDLDNDRSWYQFTSESSLGDVSLLHDNHRFSFQTGNNKFRQSNPDIEHLVSITGTSNRFLNRRQYDLDLQIPQGTELIQLSLIPDEGEQTSEPSLIFSSNYPYSIAQADEAISFFIGEWPPENIDFQLTLEANKSYTLQYQVVSGKKKVEVSSLWEQEFIAQRIETGSVKLPTDIEK